MFLRQIDLTTALRPSLLADETLLFVQDAVGLYGGKYKLPEYQNGHVYLTSHRACYVDNEDPRNRSVAVDLKDVDRQELYTRFFKSSPKVTLYAKASKRTSFSSRIPSRSYSPQPGSASTPPTARSGSPSTRSVVSSPVAPPRPSNATWVCPICSFSNPIPSNFDPATANAHTPIPPCQACGIKPPLVHVVKAAIAAISNRTPAVIEPSPQRPQFDRGDLTANAGGDSPGARTPANFQCPRCTFENHPSLLSCEVCGASLVTVPDRRLHLDEGLDSRSGSPGPLPNGDGLDSDAQDVIKFSFRAGGEKIFHERLKGALVQRKWLLQGAPPVPKPLGSTSPTGANTTAGTNALLDRQKVVGIAGLELRDQELRRNNEVVIGGAFEDLEALMTSAKEIIKLAEQFASQTNSASNGTQNEATALLSQSASALGLVTTKDMLSSGSGSESLYVSELSRNLAEFLTDDSKGILKREGGIMSLVDLWAVFNRARGGVELVSPTDFEKAAQLWDKLKLPVRLRRFKSGLLVVQGRDRTDEKTVASLLAWLRTLHEVPPEEQVPWDWQLIGRGVTAQEAAEHFGWSVGVATEELEMAEERGVLCREQGLDGIRFWENRLV